MCTAWGNEVGHIPENEVIKSAGVGGKNGGGHGNTLDTHGRDYRCYDCERTSSEARYIMDSCTDRLFFRKYPSFAVKFGSL